MQKIEIFKDHFGQSSSLFEQNLSHFQQNSSRFEQNSSLFGPNSSHFEHFSFLFQHGFIHLIGQLQIRKISYDWCSHMPRP